MSTTATVNAQLQEVHQQFITYLQHLTEAEFMQSKQQKWTAGQHLEHIVLAIKPLNMALRLPNFMLRILWGRSTRQSRSYEHLVEKYQSKLAAGGKASARFVPKAVRFGERDTLCASLQKEIQVLCKLSARYNRRQLDTLVLPHPLLGKLTLREMLYFSIYHVQHHQRLLEQSFKA